MNISLLGITTKTYIPYFGYRMYRKQKFNPIDYNNLSNYDIHVQTVNKVDIEVTQDDIWAEVHMIDRNGRKDKILRTRIDSKLNKINAITVANFALVAMGFK